MLTFADQRAHKLAPAPPLPLRFAIAMIAGLPGIAVLALVLPSIPGVPTALMLVNPLLMLALLAGLGVVAQARLPFRVRTFTKLAGRDLPLLPPQAAQTATLGVLLGLCLAIADHVARPLWQTAGGIPSLVEGWTPQALVVGLLYGGIVEEIMMRFGLVSLIALALWRLFARGEARPPVWALVAGVSIAAALFAAGHLPIAFASGGEPAPGLILRVLALNGAAGLVFGYLYVSRDLESAILAHMGAHIGFAIAAIGG